MIQFFPHPFFPVIFFYPFPQLATMSISWRSLFAKQTFLLVISLAGFTYFPGTFRVLFSLSICVLGTQFYFPVRHWCIERCSWHTFALGAFWNHSLQCCLQLSIIACISGHYADINWYVTYPNICQWLKESDYRHVLWTKYITACIAGNLKPSSVCWPWFVTIRRLLIGTYNEWVERWTGTVHKPKQENSPFLRGRFWPISIRLSAVKIFQFLSSGLTYLRFKKFTKAFIFFPFPSIFALMSLRLWE